MSVPIRFVRNSTARTPGLPAISFLPRFVRAFVSFAVEAPCARCFGLGLLNDTGTCTYSNTFWRHI